MSNQIDQAINEALQPACYYRDMPVVILAVANVVDHDHPILVQLIGNERQWWVKREDLSQKPQEAK